MTYLITEGDSRTKVTGRAPFGDRDRHSPPMDDLTRYVLIAFTVLVAWFVLALAGGYVFGRHVERRKRLFRGHKVEEAE